MKTISKISIAYVSMIIVFIGSLYAVTLIPRNYVSNNALKSWHLIFNRFEKIRGNDIYTSFSQEALYPDYYTDMLLYSVCLETDPNDPLNSIMLMNYRNIEYENSYDIGFRESYTRYWFGAEVPLTLSAIFMDLDGLIIFNCIIFWGLLIAITILTWRRINPIAAIIFFISMMGVQFYIVPFSLQFCNCFGVMLLMVLLMLIKPKWIRVNSSLYTLMFIGGGLTAFFDLLSTPTIILCYMLIYMLFIRGKDSDFKILIIAALLWIAGYAGLWISKWIIASLILHHNEISAAIHQILHRTGAIDVASDLGVHPRKLIIYLLLPIENLLVTMLCLKRMRNHADLPQTAMMLAISWIPILWMMALENHTFIHIKFVWRNIAPIIFIQLYMLTRAFTKKRNHYARIKV